MRFATFTAAFRLIRTAAPGTIRPHIIAVVMASAANAATIVLAGRVLGRLSENASWAGTLPLVIGAGVALMVGMTAALLRYELGKLAVEQVHSHTVGEVLDAASRVPFASFDSPAFYDRMRRAHEGGGDNAWAIVLSTLDLARQLIDIVLLLLVLVFVAPLLILISVLAYLPMVAVSAANARLSHRFSWDETEADRRRAYIEMLVTLRSPAREVRSFELYPQLGSQFHHIWDRRISRLRQLIGRRAVRSVIANLLSAALIATALGVVVWLTVRGRLSIEQAGIGVIAVRQLSASVGGAGNSLASLRESSAFLGDYNAFIDEANALAEPTTGEEAPATVSLISLDSLRFSYPGEPNLVFEDLSVEFRAGEVTAIVGANGSGKSTLLMLLAGLYSPTAGVIRWDGRNVNDFNPASWRRAVAPVFQDFVRFELSVRENVTLDDSPTVAARVDGALADAEASGFVADLAAGSSSQLGRAFAEGAELSNGQWQRLALARALYREAPLLLLDEPASALDPIAETRLVDRLTQSSHGRCTIFVSHRFASVSRADRIIVLDEGCIVEDGTHHGLLKAGGAYAALYRAQTGLS